MIGGYSEDDGKKLLKLARDIISRVFDKDIELEKLEGKQFMQARGVFVTLHKNSELRGCIGLPYPTKALKDAVVEASESAAFSDPRFPSLEKE